MGGRGPSWEECEPWEEEYESEEDEEDWESGCCC